MTLLLFQRTPVHSRSTEFDPFDGYSDRHEYADYPSPVPSRQGVDSNTGRQGVDSNTYSTRQHNYSRERYSAILCIIILTSLFEITNINHFVDVLLIIRISILFIL